MAKTKSRGAQSPKDDENEAVSTVDETIQEPEAETVKNETIDEEPTHQEVKLEYKPCIVYRCPGNHQCPGGTFDYKSATSPKHLEQLIKDGYHKTLPEAIEAVK